MAPLVSIVMPVYNGGPYLRRCLDGILAQTLTDFELIAVDDASTDETPAVLSSYAMKDERVSVITHASNLHAGSSRNDGLDAARGAYVLFLDADDLFEPTLLERAVACAQRAKAEVVLYGADEFRGKPGNWVDAPYLNSAFVPRKQPFSWEDVPNRIFQVCTPEPWTKLFLRSFVQGEGLRFQGMQNANDLYFTMAALALATRIATCPDRLVHHRVGRAGSIQGRKSAEPLAFLEALRALQKTLKQRCLLGPLSVSFANLALFHCIYNRQAPADWACVFSELGVLGLSRKELAIESDYRLFVEMALESSDERLGELGYGAEFWREAARCELCRSRESEAELCRVKESASFRLGSSPTLLPRKLRSVLSPGD